MRRAAVAIIFLLANGCGLFTADSDESRDSTPERLQQFLAARQDSGISPDRPIAPGDLIRVEVAGVEGASREYAVSRSGAIRLPAVGETKVGGRSAEEAREVISRRLESIVRNPVVDVRLVEVAGGQATIEGAVARSGAVSLGSKGKTLGEALTLVGGLTSEASGLIRIMEASSGATDEAIELAASDVLRDDAEERLDLYLRPGDRIEVVSESGTVASAAPDPLAELGLAVLGSPSEAVEAPPPAPRQREQPRPVTVAAVRDPAPPTPAREPLEMTAPATIGREPAAPERVAEPPPREAASTPAPRTPPVEPESVGLRAEIEALRRRAEATEVELRKQLRRAQEESAQHQREAASARAEAEAARRQLAIEHERSQELASRIMEIEAGRGGPAFAAAHVAVPATVTRSVSFERPTVAEEARAAAAVAEEAPRVELPVEESRGEPERVSAAPPASEPAPTTESEGDRIDVSGRVQFEGSQPLAAARTVLRAIMRARVAPGADVSRIEVRRRGGRDGARILVNLAEVRAGRSPDLVLENGDTIFVP